MKNHPIHPPPAPFHLTQAAAPVTAAGPVGRPAGTPGRSRLWDRLCAGAVIVVLLATGIMVCAYAAREVGLVREAGATAAAVSSAQGAAGALDAGGTPGRPARVDRSSLIALSMGIDLLIFVGLGLYLRWDGEREQAKTK